jgi:HAD superfamily hydrolase (TIGR01484 family)
MSSFPSGVLFSDVDGTFLDERYQPVLDGAALRTTVGAWRLVFVSSRTAAELHALHTRIGLRDDAIGENGGVLLSYDRDTAAALGEPIAHEDAWIVELARPIAEVRARVAPLLAAHGATEVSACSAQEMAERSGYGVADAERALTRRTSVLITAGSPESLVALDSLRAEGYTIVHGGRWVSILHGSDKGRAVTQWQRVVAPGAVTVGVGDAANDAAMLAVVDHPFVIRDPVAGPAPTLLAIPRARPLTALGTNGWLELVTTLPGLLTETP